MSRSNHCTICWENVINTNSITLCLSQHQLISKTLELRSQFAYNVVHYSCIVTHLGANLIFFRLIWGQRTSVIKSLELQSRVVSSLPKASGGFSLVRAWEKHWGPTSEHPTAPHPMRNLASAEYIIIDIQIYDYPFEFNRKSSDRTRPSASADGPRTWSGEATKGTSFGAQSNTVGE